MPDQPPVIFVDLWQSKPRQWMRSKQTWRWTAKSGANFAKLATSGENYLNKADALWAINLLFGDSSNIYLRQPNTGETLLRGPAESV